MRVIGKTKISGSAMSSSVFKFSLCFFLFAALSFSIACDKAQTAGNNDPSGSDKRNPSERSVKSFEITNRNITDNFSGVSKEEALPVSDKAFAKDFNNKDFGDVVICERLMFWSVIYEDSGNEYSISKGVKDRQDNFNTDISRWRKKLPVVVGSETSAPIISKDKAVSIAENEFKAYLKTINSDENDVKKVIPITCEIKNGWRIYLVEKKAWETGIYSNSALPDYLIDKKMGRFCMTAKSSHR